MTFPNLRREFLDGRQAVQRTGHPKARSQWAINGQPSLKAASITTERQGPIPPSFKELSISYLYVEFLELHFDSGRCSRAAWELRTHTCVSESPEMPCQPRLTLATTVCHVFSLALNIPVVAWPASWLGLTRPSSVKHAFRGSANHYRSCSTARPVGASPRRPRQPTALP